MTEKPLAEDIPLDTAWIDGRRIYIVCSRDSHLGEALYLMGAKWDKVVRARYVGTQRRTAVEPLIREHLAAKASTDKLRAEGATSTRLLAIPYKATAIRDDAKRAGAAWEPTTKQWIFPDDQTLATFRDRVSAWEQTTGQASARLRGTTCSECGRPGATIPAIDSSGLPGTVCRSCDGPSYTLSFA